MIDYTHLFESYDRIENERILKAQAKNSSKNALQAFLHNIEKAKTGSGFQRMQKCRQNICFKFLINPLLIF